jgi:GT2 family glycosyltransferase
MDLCNRVWKAGYTVLYTPEATLTHLGGQSTSKRFPPLGFALDGQVTHYRYFYKHFGKQGARQSRRVALLSLALRRFGLGVLQTVRPTEIRKSRVELLKTLFEWNYQVDPVRLVENNEEPELGFKPVGRVLER